MSPVYADPSYTCRVTSAEVEARLQPGSDGWPGWMAAPRMMSAGGDPPLARPAGIDLLDDLAASGGGSSLTDEAAERIAAEDLEQMRR